ncbi:MAG: S41 family peptidase [Planctomycetota bacterium]
MNRTTLLLIAMLMSTGIATAQDPPQVASLTPPDAACDVDSGRVHELIVVFDRDMTEGGHSVCGGGPTFPTLDGPPRWKDKRTLILKVKLQPDHDYRMSLNCPTAQSFRSAQGVPLAAVPWNFSTLPKDLPDAQRQRARNEKALALLIDALDTRYSHRDLRVTDWEALWESAHADLLGAPTDAAFASRAARALEPTADLHLYFRCGERVFGTGRRAVDPLFRFARIGEQFTTHAVGQNAVTGRSADGIGYLMIGSWSKDVDLDGVEADLAALMDARAFVIDARPNAGGDERLALRIAAWFVEGRKVYAGHRVRRKDAEDGFGPVDDRVIRGNADARRRFTGPITVLTSRYVMSSNESFVLMLRQAADCTVVGQPTCGSSGNPQPCDLGNGVTVMVPSWQDLQPDGTCFEGTGIAPDVEVQVGPRDLESRDPILERALAALREKLAK